MAKPHHSYMHHQKTKKSEEEEEEDLCPMCKESLYLNEEFSKRIGLVDENDEPYGWMCPHCKGMFDENSVLMGIHGMDEMGES